MDDRIESLERQVARLRSVVALLLIGLAVVALSAFHVGQEAEPEVIRTRGIVVTDSLGRERVLIGAPIPAAANRVRTDEGRVRELWAPRYPDPGRYMGFYADYRHDMNGILVLDAEGFDRVALGDPVPDPNIGRRIGPSTGIAINDERGFERTGYGVLDMGEGHRVVLGFDADEGEAVALYVTESGRRGLSVYSGGSALRLGRLAGDSLPECLGLALVRGDEVIHDFGAPRCP